MYKHRSGICLGTDIYSVPVMATESSVARPILQRWWPYLDRLRPIFWVDQRHRGSTSTKMALGRANAKGQRIHWRCQKSAWKEVIRSCSSIPYARCCSGYRRKGLQQVSFLMILGSSFEKTNRLIAKFNLLSLRCRISLGTRNGTRLGKLPSVGEADCTAKDL